MKMFKFTTNFFCKWNRRDTSLVTLSLERSGSNKNLNDYQRYAGFTLAEVLITLGIIGIVAAMTIPTLMNNTNDAQLKVAWKKTYSEINQATMLLKNDNGGTLVGAFSSADDVVDKYAQTLKVVKKTPYMGSWAGNYWATSTSYGDKSAMSITAGRGFILPSGAAVALYLAPTCGSAFRLSDTYSGFSGGGIINACGTMIIDVNGPKKPNEVGKDTFGLTIFEDRVIPYGAAADAYFTSLLNGDAKYKSYTNSASYLLP